MEETGLESKINIPEKTLERLLQYLRLLKRYRYIEQPFIFSHDLARVLNIKPVLVRRDLMLIGIQGNNRTGYDVNNLLSELEKKLHRNENANAVLIGIENLGTAAMEYFLSGDSPVNILGYFDFFPSKQTKKPDDIPGYGIHELTGFLATNEIKLAVIAVSSDDIDNIVTLLINSGIKSIINLGPVKLEVPDDVFLQEFDIITGLEKAAFHL